jgi:hypothetical protein
MFSYSFDCVWRVFSDDELPDLRTGGRETGTPTNQGHHLHLMPREKD